MLVKKYHVSRKLIGWNFFTPNIAIYKFREKFLKQTFYS